MLQHEIWPECDMLKHILLTLVDEEDCVGTKKTGKGRRKVGRKKRRMRSKIRHRKG